MREKFQRLLDWIQRNLIPSKWKIGIPKEFKEMYKLLKEDEEYWNPKRKN